MSLTKDLESKLHQYLAETHALEKHALRQLDFLVSATNDDQIRAALKEHRTETLRQIARLEARFEAHYQEPSELKDVGAQFSGFFKALRSMVGEDRPVKLARDIYVTEHLEIATYEVLEQLALLAGDPETARVARQNRAEEEAMANKIAAAWDRVVDEMLAEERLEDQAAGRYTREEGQHAGV